MSDTFIHSPYLLERQLLDAISVGNLDVAKQVLEKINQNPHAVLAKDELRSIKNLCICSVTIMCRAAINAGVNDQLAYDQSDQFILEIEDLNSVESVLAIETNVVTAYTKMVQNILRNNYSDIVVLAMQFIKTNVQSKISLSVVAKKVGVSATYLSAQFKKEVGTTVSKYINEAKILESVFFLKNTTMTIAEISDNYEFSNASYFTKQFRNIYGISPNQYRDRQKT